MLERLQISTRSGRKQMKNILDTLEERRAGAKLGGGALLVYGALAHLAENLFKK